MLKRRSELLARAAFCSALGLGIGQAAMAQVYSVADLGLLTDLTGRKDSNPNALNTNGLVAAANVTSGAYRAFRYNGSWTDLGTLGGDESLGAGINDSGAVVGSSATSDARTHAFLWTPGGTGGVAGNPQMTDLGTFVGGTNSKAFAINHAGQITGFSETNTITETLYQAFRYSGGKMADIGKLLGPGLPNSYGYGINDAGHIAGAAYDPLFTSPHAFFYNGTSAQDLGTFGGRGAVGLAINDSDQLVGYLTTGAWFDHAFLYVAGVVTDLGTLGGDYSYAIGINNSNVVVGGSFVDTNNTVYHAFLWSGNTLVDLNSQLDSSGAGWTLGEARAINDRSQIVGVGTLNGEKHAFLLTPHEVTPVALGVSPGGGLSASGAVGGPFSPASMVYTLTNSGGSTLNWTASGTQIWLTLSATNGTLAARASATVTVSINTNANSLPVSTNITTITFSNLTAGSSAATRQVVLYVYPLPFFVPGSVQLSNGFHARLQGVPGWSYVLQGSQWLTNWTAVATNQAAADGSVDFIDSTSGSFSRRCYRAKAPP